MRPIIKGPPEPDAPKPPLRSRLVWFAGLALASATIAAVIAYTLKALLPS